MHDTRVMPPEPKVVGQRYSHCLLLLDVRDHHDGVDTFLRAVKVDGRMQPAYCRGGVVIGNCVDRYTLDLFGGP